MIRILKIFTLFIILTLTTQIGGVVLLVSLWISSRLKESKRYTGVGVFLVLYCVSTFGLVPIIAPYFGREKVIHTNHLYPTTMATVFLNRNYVRPALNDLLIDVSNAVKVHDIELRYLDANFPFMDGFPLLPHRSHDDGKKIDISFVYVEPGSNIDSHKKKSLSGYGVCEGPIADEVNQISVCKSDGYWQYDYSQYFTFGSINKDLEFSPRLNSIMINSILRQKALGKLFIEPHLKNRLRLKHNKVRYHGCKAVRHDDHIHVQL